MSLSRFAKGPDGTRGFKVERSVVILDVNEIEGKVSQEHEIGSPNENIDQTENLSDIIIRSMTADDISEAEYLRRIAFSDLVSLSPEDWGEVNITRTRAAYMKSFVAVKDNRIVGANFAVVWGSVGWFGPISVDPSLQGAGIGKRLLNEMMDYFRSMDKVRRIGLFTFPDSPRHISFYMKYGFQPKYLIAVLSRNVSAHQVCPPYHLFSQVPRSYEHLAMVLDLFRKLSTSAFEGLDVGGEITATRRGSFGDTLYLVGRDESWASVRGIENEHVIAFALFQHGPQTEAWPNTLRVKFATATSLENLSLLLCCLEDYCVKSGLEILELGTNTGRTHIFQFLLGNGFRMIRTGIAMELGEGEGYNTPHAIVIDDWR